MRAMILAAGRGTRLQPYTDTTPKPMLTVAGRPLIEHQLGWLRDAGIVDVVINLHHLGEQIRAHVGDGSVFGVSVRYSVEEQLLETGGGIVKALPMLGENPFLILNGDIFTDFPLETFPRDLPNGSRAHLLLTPTPDFREAGDFEWAGGRVTSRGTTYVYCGIALLHPTFFDGCTIQPFSLADLYFEAIEQRALTGEVWNGRWTDIGTPEQLEALQGIGIEGRSGFSRD
ncbi:MAG: nucleotidyltransferase family protein [Gammaproteobacteria bacterium]|nr:nucleotidyltransferase family protein [Gammaproteobacteria bacterium]